MKLEVGKKYLTIDGEIGEVYSIDDDDDNEMPVVATFKTDYGLSSFYYTIDGKLGRWDYRTHHGRDMVSEYPTPEPEQTS